MLALASDARGAGYDLREKFSEDQCHLIVCRFCGKDGWEINFARATGGHECDNDRNLLRALVRGTAEQKASKKAEIAVRGRRGPGGRVGLPIMLYIYTFICM